MSEAIVAALRGASAHGVDEAILKIRAWQPRDGRNALLRGAILAELHGLAAVAEAADDPNESWWPHDDDFILNPPEPSVAKALVLDRYDAQGVGQEVRQWLASRRTTPTQRRPSSAPHS